MRNPIPLFILAMLLPGCSGSLLNLGSSPAYVDGYQDGCTSASARSNTMAAQPTQDEARFKSQPDYAEGWQDGMQQCNGASFNTHPTLGNDSQGDEVIDLSGPR